MERIGNTKPTADDQAILHVLGTYGNLAGYTSKPARNRFRAAHRPAANACKAVSLVQFAKVSLVQFGFGEFPAGARQIYCCSFIAECLCSKAYRALNAYCFDPVREGSAECRFRFPSTFKSNPPSNNRWFGICAG